MTVETWLVQAQKQLETANIPTARLDSLVLLEDCLQLDRAQLLAHPERVLKASEAKRLAAELVRRAEHEPLAYIRGKTEFYGREFYVDHRVLEPRPESETMIDLLKNLELGARPQIADIGTGSGALAITAKLELPQAQVIGIDIDPGCLAVARQNAEALKAQVNFQKGNLVAQLPPSNVLLCNLPYVPDNFQINPAAMREPRIAIFGGPDGLDLYRQLFGGLKQRPKYILTEALPPQHEDLAAIAKENHYRLTDSSDFIQVFSTL